MKTWIQTLFIFITLAVLNGSCSVVTPESSTPTSSFTSVSVPTGTPAAVTPIITNAAVSEFDLSCWAIKPLNENNNIEGSLVYTHFASTRANKFDGLFAWDISSFRSVSLKGSYTAENRMGGFVSPDGKFLAVLSGKSLILVSHDDIQSFPLPNNNLSIRSYLPDGRILLIDQESRKSNYKKGIGLTEIYFIFDPKTGKTTRHSVFLPELSVPEYWEDYYQTFAIQYSPDMKHVLYRSTPDESGFTFTLYDLEKNAVVWIGPPRNADLEYLSIPEWRPDAKSLVANFIDVNTHHSNYYLISLDGKIFPIANISKFDFTDNTRSFRSWGFYNYAQNWSPDGRYLVATGDNAFMYIWDDQEKVGYKPCLPQSALPYDIVWSFNGSYFTVTVASAPPTPPTELPPPMYIYKVYLLDVAKKIIYEMPDKNIEPADNKDEADSLLGWVNWEIP